MIVTEIKDVRKITNKKAIELAKNLKDNEILLILNDGNCAIVPKKYNGIIRDSQTNEPISRIPVDTNWRPVSIGLRLYNCEVREYKSLLYGDLSYILSFYQK